MTASAPATAPGVRSRWNTIPAGLRAALVVAVLFVMLIASVGIVDRATRGRQQRSYDTRGSARSTATNGVKAFRLLLDHYDISTTDLAGSLHAAVSRGRLPLASTLLVLDSPFPTDADRRAVNDFARAGGRVIVAGSGARDWINTRRPGITHSELRTSLVRFHRRYLIQTSGTTRWSTARGPELVVTRTIGAGHILLVAESSIFQNQLLGKRDNAALALALVGDTHQVGFAEGPHGLSGATGWSAIPGGWKVAIIGSALALLLAATARGRRIGPAERAGRALDPPRRASADALAAALGRARRPDAALGDLRTITRQRVIAVGVDAASVDALTADATDAAVHGAALAAGYSPSEAAALVGPLSEKQSIIALGRAFARSQRGTL